VQREGNSNNFSNPLILCEILCKLKKIEPNKFKTVCDRLKSESLEDTFKELLVWYKLSRSYDVIYEPIVEDNRKSDIYIKDLDIYVEVGNLHKTTSRKKIEKILDMTNKKVMNDLEEKSHKGYCYIIQIDTTKLPKNRDNISVCKSVEELYQILKSKILPIEKNVKSWENDDYSKIINENPLIKNFQVSECKITSKIIHLEDDKSSFGGAFPSEYSATISKIKRKIRDDLNQLKRSHKNIIYYYVDDFYIFTYVLNGKFLEDIKNCIEEYQDLSGILIELKTFNNYKYIENSKAKHKIDKDEIEKIFEIKIFEFKL